MSKELLILGGSTRAAAWSALRAGYAPICADLFLDTDLQAVARVLPVTGYPDGLWEAVRHLPPTPWIYTGAVENHPLLIARISERHPLRGASPTSLARVRDPWWLAAQIPPSSGIVTPELRNSQTPPLVQETWLIKPLNSGGGRNISRSNAISSDSPLLREPHYFQQFVSGEVCSALFLATTDHCLLLGMAGQLAPTSQDRSEEHQWRWHGSYVPFHVSTTLEADVQYLGRTLATRAELRGLFGCDFVFSDGKLWLLEVNPRLTASVELYEHLMQIPLLQWHLDACTGTFTDASWERVRNNSPATPAVFMKRILYAERDFQLPWPPPWNFPSIAVEGTSPWQFPTVADLPVPGSNFHRGDPVCTVFACGASLPEAEAQLHSRILDLRSQLGWS